MPRDVLSGGADAHASKTKIKSRKWRGVRLSVALMLAGQIMCMSVVSAADLYTDPSTAINDLPYRVYINKTHIYSIKLEEIEYISDIALTTGAKTYEVSGNTITIKNESGDTIQTFTYDPTNHSLTDTTAPAPPTPPSGGDTADDQLKSLVETRAASMALLNFGSDLLASTGFQQAANAVALESDEESGGAESGFTPYAAIGASSLRVNSGSHVDLKGWGINVGFARELTNNQGKLLFGPVIEYGNGNYDSYVNDVKASGNSSYYGLGIMARQQNKDGIYYEGSLRLGKTDSDYGCDGQSYDTDSGYWAAHLGAGKVFSLQKDNKLDTYLKYFYTHQNGDTVTYGGAPLDFDAVDSHRLRLGTRLTHSINEKNSVYGGLAYQYEFGDEARATYNGTSTPSPSIKGSSGMLELGWQIKPSGPVTLDLGLTGWVGKQRGGSIQFGATWAF